MPIYKMNNGLINGVDYRNCPILMTVKSNKIIIRFVGEKDSFIEAPLTSFVDGAGNAFASLDAFKTHWNTYYAQLQVVVLT